MYRYFYIALGLAGSSKNCFYFDEWNSLYSGVAALHIGSWFQNFSLVEFKLNITGTPSDECDVFFESKQIQAASLA